MYVLAESATIGILVFSVSIQPCIIAVASLKEKELGIYRRILVAPVSELLYSLGLFLAVYLVTVVEIVIVLVVIYLIPGVDLGLGFGELLVVLLVFGISAGAYGVMLTSLVSGSTQGAVVANITIIFASLLSGCFWPISIMPEYLRNLARILPQTWVNLAVERLAHGADSTELAPILILLLLYGAVFLLTYALLRRRVQGE
jgi:ABC-2 type transport system permease protein